VSVPRADDEMLTVNVLAFRESDFWVAQCLEYDISARSDTLAKAMTALRRAFAANLAANRELGRKALEGIPPAPLRFRQMFESAESVQEKVAVGRPVAVADLRVAEAA
jgi:hypothetical protein